jgi:hypothetical protein
MNKITSTVCALAISFVASGANSATLLADGALNTAGDLTRVSEGASVLEFLDWTVTIGQSAAAALATYSAAGFSVATETQMASLFSAFGMTYAFLPGNYVDLTASGNVTSAQASAFTASVGATFYDAALATYANSAANGPYSYLCVSVSSCSPASFTSDTDISSGDSIVGIALVRTGGISAVPVPAGLPLLLTGLAGFVGLRRKQKRAA